MRIGTVHAAPVETSVIRSRWSSCSRRTASRPSVVVAGLLHDVLEDTTVARGELRERFGSGVVEALTQDDSLDDYDSERHGRHPTRRDPSARAG